MNPSSWKIERDTTEWRLFGITSEYRDEDDTYRIFIARELDKETAEFIIKTANCHHDLLEALNTVKKHLEFNGREKSIIYKPVCAAIAKAEGESS